MTVRGSESSYCFDGLTPDTLYNATVYTQTPNMEGPGVSVKERTCEIASLMLTSGEEKHRCLLNTACVFFVVQWSNPQRCPLSLPPLLLQQQSPQRWMVRRCFSVSAVKDYLFKRAALMSTISSVPQFAKEPKRTWCSSSTAPGASATRASTRLSSLSPA